MIKKVSKENLKLGMFIHDLNCAWWEHSFIRSSFMLRREEDLVKLLKSSIEEVYIDTVKGLDDSNAPTKEEVDHEISTRLMNLAALTKGAPAQTTHQEEIRFAKEIQNDAVKVINGILGDVRLGKQIEMERVSPMVGHITDSILRNPGALVSLCRIKESDKYTFQHSVSVATLLIAFCRGIEMDRDVLLEAGTGGMLHDIGKMRVPDHILNKPGKLTDEEFAIMQSHVTLGLEVLRQTPNISPTVMQVSGEHHEKFAGKGYPENLQGTQISQIGRMAAIVDVYDAITSNRVYHTGMEPAVALKKLFEWSEHHFDPDLVQRFIQAVGIYPVGSLVRLDSQRIGVVVEQGEAGLLYPIVKIVYDIKRRQKVTPFNLDLSRPEAGGDQIHSHEQPETWKLNPFDYLTLEI